MEGGRDGRPTTKLYNYGYERKHLSNNRKYRCTAISMMWVWLCVRSYLLTYCVRSDDNLRTKWPSTEIFGILTITRWSSSVKVTHHSSRSQEKNVPFWVKMKLKLEKSSSVSAAKMQTLIWNRCYAAEQKMWLHVAYKSFLQTVGQPDEIAWCKVTISNDTFRQYI